MKILFTTLLTLSISYANSITLKQRDLATGEGIGFGVELKSKYYNLSQDEVDTKCKEMATKKGTYAKRSDAHYSIVVGQCIEAFNK